MDRLASCYFCGDAVDAQLQEYSLVSSDRLDTGRTIVLCPSCRQKLDTVVADVLDVATDDGSTIGDRSIEFDDDPLETLSQSTDESQPTGTDAEPTNGDGTPSSDDHVADATTTANRDTVDDATIDGDEDSSNNADTVGDGTTLDGESAKSDPTSNGGPDEREPPSDDGQSGETGDTAGRPASTDTQAAADFERAEYNKVVKLLQNREFPVGVEEITVVARSAYEIDRQTTHAILDALIDRGVLEDRGDELVRA